MNVNFVKEFGKSKYIIIDPNDDAQIQKIRSFSNSPTFFIFNDENHRTVKLTAPQFKNLFTKNIEELEKMLNSIIKRNADIEYEKLKNSLNEIAEETFNNEINNFCILKYIGEFNSLADIPTKLDVGSVFEINKEFRTEHYIVLNNENILRIYSKSEIDEELSNYYKNNIVDDQFSLVNEKLAGIENTLENEIHNVNEKFESYFTNEEFEELRKNFEYDVIQFKEYVLEKFKSELDELKTTTNQRIDIISGDFEKFKSNTIESYDQTISELTNEIYLLNDKLNELSKLLDD
jgi:hypothetical protein